MQQGNVSKSISLEEYQRINRILKTALDHPDISDWDYDFCNDLVDRVDKYRLGTMLSTKQWEQIDRIERQYVLCPGGSGC